MLGFLPLSFLSFPAFYRILFEPDTVQTLSHYNSRAYCWMDLAKCLMVTSPFFSSCVARSHILQLADVNFNWINTEVSVKEFLERNFLILPFIYTYTANFACYFWNMAIFINVKEKFYLIHSPYISICHADFNPLQFTVMMTVDLWRISPYD